MGCQMRILPTSERSPTPVFRNHMPNTIPVFAYGTLKRGHGNHRLLEAATFLGEAATIARYALHVDGLPMVDRSNPVSPIHGELYLVDDATFADLDRLEGHPRFYRRFLTRVSMADGIMRAAWMYFGNDPSGPIIQSGRYENGPRLSVNEAPGSHPKL